jgi:hypothetical protein
MGNKSYSKGISWFDDCRIPFVDDGDKGSAKPQGRTTITKNGLFNPNNNLVRIELETTQGQGRFPANLLVCDDMLNDGVISGENKIQTIIEKTKGSKIYGAGSGLPPQGEFQVKYDKGTSSRYYNIDKWFDNIISE